MAQFFKAQKRNSKTTRLPVLDIAVDTVDHHGKGICLSHKPIIVVANAVPGELYKVQITEQKQRVWFAKIVKVLKANEHRSAPFCQHYNECGGCSQQDFSASYQYQVKQDALEVFLRKNLDDSVFPPSVSFNDVLPYDDTVRTSIATDPKASKTPAIAYRRKARLSIDARQASKVKIGYRAKQSNKIIDINVCPILDTPIQAPLFALTQVLKTLPIVKMLGHMTVLSDKQRQQVCLHLTKAPDYSALTQLKEATREIDLELTLELPESYEKSSPKSLVSLSNLVDAKANLANCQKLNASFSICDDGETNIMLSPNHFIQVNAEVNIDMLQTAKQWLSLTKEDTLVDLFAGLGNFSLHFANDVRQCIAAEGVAEMVELGKQNAALNGLSNVLFKHVDLSDIGAFKELNIPENSTFIIDPARQGALELMQVFSKLKPKRILYVSCNPVSFARDINCLDEKYQIKQIKALDMFPFTEHIEMMALLERE